MNKTTLKTIGTITVLIYFIFGLAALIMHIINFDITNVPWAFGPWKYVAPLQLIVTIYILFPFIIGILIFTSFTSNNLLLTLVSTSHTYKQIVYNYNSNFIFIFLINRHIRFNRWNPSYKHTQHIKLSNQTSRYNEYME